jgi:peptidoglycan hydrolase-like protein with peptidoglycan-binding domain
MNLLNTLLVYLTMVFVSSVQMAPEPSPTPLVTSTPAPVAIVATATSAAATPTAIPTATPTPVPTPAITPNNAYHTLQVGDRGDEVTSMQRRLAELGYYTGNIDGAFGNETRRAVERFQYNQGLSVDGIAGKRTLTVLYESTEVVPAPTDTANPAPTVTPAPTFAPTPTPKATTTPTPATDTPSPTPTVTPTATPVATPAPTAIAPELLANVKLVFSDSEESMTLQSDTAKTSEAVDLHPLKNGEALYMPMLEIFRDAGNVILPGTATGTTREVAFSLDKDLYQLTYQLDEENHVSNVEVLKNQKPLLITDRSAFVLDDVLYLPLQAITDATGMTFTLNDAGSQYTVNLPGTVNTDETAATKNP